MLSPREYEHIVAAYQYHCLKSMTFLCSQPLKQAFSILKSAYYSIPTRLEHTMASLVSCLQHAANRRKGMLFRAMGDGRRAQQYQRGQAWGLVRAVVVSRHKEQQMWAFLRLKAQGGGGRSVSQSGVSEGQQLEYLDLQMGLIESIVSQHRRRLLTQGYLVLKRYAGSRQSKKSREISEIPQKSAMGAIILIITLTQATSRRYNIALQHISTSNTAGPIHQQARPLQQPHPLNPNQQPPDEHDPHQPQIQVNLIRSILSITLQHSSKAKPTLRPGPRPNPTTTRRSATTIAEVLEALRARVLNTGLQAMAWTSVRGYDEEAIDKLHAQIEILQQQFDSL